MIFGYLMFSTLLSCLRWNESSFTSSDLFRAQVPQLYRSTGFTRARYSLSFVDRFILSPLIQTLVSLLSAAFESCFRLFTSLVSPISEPTFFALFHSSLFLDIVVNSVLFALTWRRE